MMEMLPQFGVACLLVAAGMFITFFTMRLAANLLILLIFLGAFGGACYAIFDAQWVGWGQIILGSLATGLIAALLSLPALPFSSFYKRGK